MSSNVQKTKNIMAGHYNDLMPDGWWISLHGYRMCQRREWSWRKFRFVKVSTYPDYAERVELTQRCFTPTRLVQHQIIPSQTVWRFMRCQPGLYDRIALRATKDGAVIDLHDMATIRIHGQFPVGSQDYGEPVPMLPTGVKPSLTVKADGGEIVLTLSDWTFS